MTRWCTRLVVVALVAASLPWWDATVPPAGATVQAPFVCPSPLSQWSPFRFVGGADDLMTDDVAPRDDPDNVIGPDKLGVHVGPSEGVRSNDLESSDLVGALGPNPLWDAVLFTGPSHAQDFALSPNGAYVWEPVDGYLGGDSFTYGYYTSSDDTCWGHTATVTIPPPAKARLVDDVYHTRNDGTFTTPRACGIGGCGVLVNDLSNDGLVLRVGDADDHTINVPGPPLTTAHGVVEMDADGSFRYTPHAGFVGTDEFSYMTHPDVLADHTLAGLPAARVVMNVSAAPPPGEFFTPSAVDDDFEIAEDSSLTLFPGDLLANDTAANTVVGNTTTPAHGSLQVNTCTNISCPIPGGNVGFGEVTSLVYTPDPDFHGADWFGYRVGHSSPQASGFGNAVVYVNVTAVIDPATAVADTFSVPAHEPATLNVLANDHDPDDRHTSVALIGTPLPDGSFHGEMDWNGDGSFTYTPDGTVPSIVFSYFLSGPYPFQNENVAAVTIDVTPNPTVDDSYSTDEDTTLFVAQPGVSGNDFGDAPLLVTPPEHGTLFLSMSGSFSYQPDPDFHGTDTFVYSANGDPATVTITVHPVDDPPHLTLNNSCVPTDLIPCIGVPDNRGNLDEGETGVLHGYIRDIDFSVGELVVDWGDGQQSTTPYPCFPHQTVPCPFTDEPMPGLPPGCGVAPCEELLFFQFEHVYGDDPPNPEHRYDITATVTQSSNGATATASERAIVHDVPPTVTVLPDCPAGSVCSFASQLTNPAGGSVTLRGRVTDPADTDGTVTVDWGDGATSTVPLDCATGPCPLASAQSTPFCATATAPLPACGYFTATHTYGAGATFLIDVTATIDGVSVGASASATVAIAPFPAPRVLPGAATVTEGDAGTQTMNLPVTLSAASDQTVTAQWTTLSLTGEPFASEPDDYTAASGVVTFAPGETAKTVFVTVNGDLLNEVDEYVVVSFHTPTNARIGGFWGLGFGTITNDDPLPRVLPGAQSVVEGDAGSVVVDVPVMLSAPSGRAVTVEWTTLPVAGAQFATAPDDYAAASGLVTFAPGETAKTVPIVVNGDTLVEQDEYVVVSFRNPVNARIGGYLGLGFGVVQDDD